MSVIERGREPFFRLHLLHLLHLLLLRNSVSPLPFVS